MPATRHALINTASCFLPKSFNFRNLLGQFSVQLQNIALQPNPRLTIADRKMKQERFGNAPEVILTASQVLLFLDGIEIVIERRSRATKSVQWCAMHPRTRPGTGGSLISASWGVLRSSLNVRSRGASVKIENRNSSRQTAFGYLQLFGLDMVRLIQ